MALSNTKSNTATTEMKVLDLENPTLKIEKNAVKESKNRKLFIVLISIILLLILFLACALLYPVLLKDSEFSRRNLTQVSLDVSETIKNVNYTQTNNTIESISFEMDWMKNHFDLTNFNASFTCDDVPGKPAQICKSITLPEHIDYELKCNNGQRVKSLIAMEKVGDLNNVWPFKSCESGKVLFKLGESNFSSLNNVAIPKMASGILILPFSKNKNIEFSNDRFVSLKYAVSENNECPDEYEKVKLYEECKIASNHLFPYENMFETFWYHNDRSGCPTGCGLILDTTTCGNSGMKDSNRVRFNLFESNSNYASYNSNTGSAICKKKVINNVEEKKEETMIKSVNMTLSEDELRVNKVEVLVDMNENVMKDVEVFYYETPSINNTEDKRISKTINLVNSFVEVVCMKNDTEYERSNITLPLSVWPMLSSTPDLVKGWVKGNFNSCKEDDKKILVSGDVSKDDQMIPNTPHKTARGIISLIKYHDNSLDETVQTFKGNNFAAFQNTTFFNLLNLLHNNIE